MSDIAPSQAPAPEATPLLDLPQLETFIDLGEEAFLDILGDAIHQVPIYFERIRCAIQTADIPLLQSSAHKLRGTLLTFGCNAISNVLAHLEQQTAVPAAQADIIHAELQALWEQSLTAIKHWEQSVPEFAP